MDGYIKGMCGRECVAVYSSNHIICKNSNRGAMSSGRPVKISDLCFGCSEKIILDLEKELRAAKTDIASLLWLNGNCEYCKHGQIEKYGNAERWKCKLGNGVDCHAQWRGIENKEE